MSDTKCPLLWNHFCVHTVGSITPCCRTDHRKAQAQGGFWHNAKISQGIWSEHHIQARQDMREGKRVIACEICYRDEDLGIRSARHHYLEQYPNIDYTSEPTQIQEIDIKFNSTCNLGCRMCAPTSSSVVNKDISDIPQSDRIHSYRSDRSFNFLEQEKLEFAKSAVENGLTHFKVTGGEPFVQKHFLEFVDWCIEHNHAQNLNLQITTNLILFDKAVFEKFLKFKHVFFTVSVDGYGETYDYIRYKADWKTLSKNLLIIGSQEYNNFVWNTSAVLTIYNLFNLEKLYKYIKTYNFKNFDHFAIDVNIKPYDLSELNVKNLPDDVIRSACKTDLPPKTKKYLFSLIGKPKDNYMLKEFARKTKIYDTRRNQSYTVLDKRIVDLINSYEE